MFGKNKITRIQKRSEEGLMVNDIFYTLQGECFFSGHPAVFLMLAGCNLQCSFCDTDFESYARMQEAEILNKIIKERRSAKLVVITGGEPLLQDIANLCRLIVEAGLIVQIETNGTVGRNLPKEAYVVCSPKFHKRLGFAIDKNFAPNINAFKFLISAGIEEYSFIPEEFMEYGLPIYAQPMDEMDEIKNQKNLELCKNICLSKGYILSLQTHKIIGIK